MLCDDLGVQWESRREHQDGGDICIHIADSRFYIAETSTTL